jgi:hypothetical protein
MNHSFIYAYWLLPDKNSPNDITKVYLDDHDLIVELIDNLNGDVLNYVRISREAFVDIIRLMVDEL